MQDSVYFLNKQTFPTSESTVDVKSDDIEILADGMSFYIQILQGDISQETVLGYQEIYNSLYKSLDNGALYYDKMKDLFSKNNTSFIPLCSFNKKFDKLTQSSNRDEILKEIKYLPHIFYRPKLHLKQIEEVRPASLVTRIGSESIRHLASHSEHWKGIKVNGLVPERLLARILEDDYAIYENVVAKTLIDRLYEIEKAEKEDVIDCEMSFNLEESYSQGGERQNFFDALNYIFKSFSKDRTSSDQQLISEIRKTIDDILSYISKCKSSKLYRQIRKEKAIHGNLKKTNIFMMDNYYKKVYHLWQRIGKPEEAEDIQDKKSIDIEYFTYIEILLLFTLNYMGYTSEDDKQIMLKENLFDNVILSFGNWSLNIKSYYAKLFDGLIELELSDKISKTISFSIPIPDCSDFSKYKIFKSGNKLTFGKKLSQIEMQELLDLLSVMVEKNKRAKWRSDFINQISEGMRSISVKSTRILFIPWKYGFSDDIEAGRVELEKIKALIPNGYDEYYILNISRPNELKNIKDEAFLSQLVSYALRNKYSDSLKNLGIIPICTNDINSFRRIAKILLKNMILLKDIQTICPQCGSKLTGNEQDGYKCFNQLCGFEIYNTRCTDCNNEYWYTNYKFPKVFHFPTELPGMKILLKENDYGFKNITNLNFDHSPECPYCKSDALSIKQTGIKYEDLFLKKRIIVTTKKKETAELNINPDSFEKFKDSVSGIRYSCPFCSLYNKDTDVSLIYHIQKKHLQYARSNGYMIFSGNQIVCENCKSIISSCTDQAVLNHIQKKCERRTQTERKKVVVVKKRSNRSNE